LRLSSIILVRLMLAPVLTFAQEATPASPPAAPPTASAPPVTATPAADGAGPSSYFWLAIAAGAVFSVVVLEALTGGTMTFAQEATPASPSAAPPTASAAPVTATPAADGAGSSSYFWLAIGASAAFGVVVLEALTSGTITPLFAAGGTVMPQAAAASVGYGYWIFETVKVAAGAGIGGYVSNRLYRE